MSGLPDIDSLETYGGAKEDYAPAEDSSTDESAEHRNLYAMNVAAMTQTALRAWCRFAGHATTPTITTHGAVWGDDNSVKPTPAHSSTGVYTLTYPTTITDELGEEHTVNLRCAEAHFEGSTPYVVNATVTSANVVTVRVWNSSFALNDAAGVTFGVFVT